MIYVGIDIAKLNHYASAISSGSEVLFEPFRFSNDNDGFCTLVSKLKDRFHVYLSFKITAQFQSVKQVMPFMRKKTSDLSVTRLKSQ